MERDSSDKLGTLSSISKSFYFQDTLKILSFMQSPSQTLLDTPTLVRLVILVVTGVLSESLSLEPPRYFVKADFFDIKTWIWQSLPENISLSGQMLWEAELSYTKHR